MTEKNAMELTDAEFERAVLNMQHTAHWNRVAAETEAYLVQHGFKEATPPTPPADLPNAKPFDAQTDAYLRREFPDQAEYMLKKFGLKETK